MTSLEYSIFLREYALKIACEMIAKEGYNNGTAVNAVICSNTLLSQVEIQLESNRIMG